MQASNEGDAPAPGEGLRVAAEEELRSLIATMKAELSSVQPLVESARQEITALSAARGQAEALLTEIQSKVADAQTNAAAILAANQQIENARASAEASSTAIGSKKEEVDALQTELGLQLTTAKVTVGKADEALSQANQARDSAVQALEAVEASKVTGGEAVAEVMESKKQGAIHAAALQSLADKAKDVDARISRYEQKLAEFEEHAKKQLADITGLLPGATSAGLASAFDERRKSFLEPGTGWQKLFIGSIVLLILLAASGLIQAWIASAPMGYEEILRLWLTRLPIAAALVWLALHSSREAALAKRLEEDYGYKVAIASTFLGFQKQMSEIGGAVEATSPLGRLCDETLAIISSPPGRIYEKQALTVTPGSELAGAARTMGVAVSEAAGAQRPKA